MGMRTVKSVFVGNLVSITAMAQVEILAKSERSVILKPLLDTPPLINYDTFSDQLSFQFII